MPSIKVIYSKAQVITNIKLQMIIITFHIKILNTRLLTIRTKIINMRITVYQASSTIHHQNINLL